jgi:hypothetical protein
MEGWWGGVHGGKLSQQAPSQAPDWRLNSVAPTGRSPAGPPRNLLDLPRGQGPRARAIELGKRGEHLHAARMRRMTAQPWTAGAVG